jgi:hypothetical protein
MKKHWQTFSAWVVRCIFRKVPKESTTLAEFCANLQEGMRIDEMPRFIALPSGQVLDVSLPADQATLKSLLKGGNRKKRRAKEATKRHG